ncbi:MAG: hypothetical protein ACFFEF_03410 [Candidatus Thorarchaeota archaeon]
MKPLGTITVFFPYVDGETRRILNSLMVEANDFNDFSEALFERVVSEDTPVLTQYLNFYFLLFQFRGELLRELVSRDKVPLMAKPIELVSKSDQSEMVSWEEMKQILGLALEEAPNEWFVCHVYLSWRLFLGYFSIYPSSNIDMHPYESVISNIQANKEFEYFKLQLFLIESFGHREEFQFSKAIEANKQALEIARKYDDQLSAAIILSLLGQLAKHTDLKAGIDFALEGNEIQKQLGNKGGLALAQHFLGHIMGIRGEFDAAIEHQLEYRTLCDFLSIPTAMIDGVIAMYCNMAGKGQDALNIVKDISEEPEIYEWNSQVQKAWALSLLGQNEEARVEYDKFRKFALKSGDIDLILRMDIMEGILDQSEGDLKSAEKAFEKLLKSFKDNPVPVFENLCLLHLVDMEIEQLDDDTLSVKHESSGRWMDDLDTHLSKHDFPGILAQAKILKAKLRQKQTRTREVQDLIRGVLEVSESPSMKYLRNLVAKTFPKLVET